jgi:hypothetical protein
MQLCSELMSKIFIIIQLVIDNYLKFHALGLVPFFGFRIVTECFWVMEYLSSVDRHLCSLLPYHMPAAYFRILRSPSKYDPLDRKIVCTIQLNWGVPYVELLALFTKIMEAPII